MSPGVLPPSGGNDGFERRPADWLSFDQARDRIVAAGDPLPPQEVRLEEVDAFPPPALSAEVRTPATLPPGPTSAMDGYVLRRADVEEADRADSSPRKPLPVVGASRPGHPTEPLPEGSAARIMTGGLLPEGADTVIPVEHTDREAGGEGRLLLLEPLPEEGRFIRPAGEEMTRGEVLARPGDALSPGLLALLASAGVPQVQLHERPRVGLLVTGDELIGLEEVEARAEALHQGRARVDVLTPSLEPLVREAGGRPLKPRRVGDDRVELRRALTELATEADLVITTGGASMGDADLLKRTLDELDHELLFWRIRMRPGSPVSLGRLQVEVEGRSKAVPVLGLPGNPVSALVTFLLLGRPLIRRLGGHREVHLPRIRARAADPLPGHDHLTLFPRVRLLNDSDGRWEAYTTGSQSSGVTASVARAQGVAVVTAGSGGVDEGTEVPVVLFPLGLG